MAEFVMGRACMDRVCYGPSLSWAEFVMGRVVQLPIQILPKGSHSRFADRGIIYRQQQQQQQ